MAIQTLVIEPPLTPDQVVAKVNAASDNISRAGSVEAAARPIEDAEITAAKLADVAARDNLLALSDTDRAVVVTQPAVGEFPIVAVERNADGLVEVKYDDVAIE